MIASVKALKKPMGVTIGSQMFLASLVETDITGSRQVHLCGPNFESVGVLTVSPDVFFEIPPDKVTLLPFSDRLKIFWTAVQLLFA